MTFHYDTDPLRPQVEKLIKASLAHNKRTLAPEEAYLLHRRSIRTFNDLCKAWGTVDTVTRQTQPNVEQAVRYLDAAMKCFERIMYPITASGKTDFRDAMDFHARLGLQSIEVGRYASNKDFANYNDNDALETDKVAYYLTVYTKGVTEDTESLEVETVPYRDPIEGWVATDPVYLFPINGQTPETAHPGTSIEYLFDAQGKFLRIHVCA